MMSPAFSLYLDIIRFGAAIAVVLHHVWSTLFPDFPLPWPGHHAVIAFFVLSGLVIAHAASRPDRTWRDYVQHRTARVLSVAYPALLLAAVLGFFVDPSRPFYGSPAVADDFWYRILINLGFQGQTWFLNIGPPFNSPYWSLNFEVWYYVIFGLWIYGARWRMPLAFAGAVLAGPKILLLLPVWLMGVAVYRFRPQLTEDRAIAVFATTVILFLMLFWFDIPQVVGVKMTARWPGVMGLLGEEQRFAGDIVLGLIVAANFMAAANMPKTLSGLLRFKTLIRYPASLTFSAYLYHVPLFIFLTAALGITSPVPVALLLIAGIVVLGQLTERQAPQVRAALARVGLGRAPSAIDRKVDARDERGGV